MFPMGKHILPMSRQQIYANLHPILLEDPQGRLHFHSSKCCWQFQRSGVGHPGLPRPWFFHRSEDLEARPHSVISLRSPLEAASLWPGSTMFNPGEKAEKAGLNIGKPCWQDQNPQGLQTSANTRCNKSLSLRTLNGANATLTSRYASTPALSTSIQY